MYIRLANGPELDVVIVGKREKVKVHVYRKGIKTKVHEIDKRI